MAIIVLLNNFFHDFSAAGWLFCTVILWAVLRREIPGGDCGRFMGDTIRTVLLLMRISLIGIVVFGVGRTLAYKTYEWNAAAGDGQITLLVVKHILLTGVFLVGVVYYRRGKKAALQGEDTK